MHITHEKKREEGEDLRQEDQRKSSCLGSGMRERKPLRPGMKDALPGERKGTLGSPFPGEAGKERALEN